LAKDAMPVELQVERDAIIAEIYAAWKGVRRPPGVGWHEACAKDDYAGDTELAAARRLDSETSWEQLIGKIAPHDGALFSYLSAKSIGYYAAPLLVEAVRSGVSDGLEWIEPRAGEIGVERGFTPRQFACLNRATKYLGRVGAWRKLGK
jgi:hypothetical protein